MYILWHELLLMSAVTQTIKKALMNQFNAQSGPCIYCSALLMRIYPNFYVQLPAQLTCNHRKMAERIKLATHLDNSNIKTGRCKVSAVNSQPV